MNTTQIRKYLAAKEPNISKYLVGGDQNRAKNKEGTFLYFCLCTPPLQTINM